MKNIISESDKLMESFLEYYDLWKANKIYDDFKIPEDYVQSCLKYFIRDEWENKEEEE